MAVILSGLTSCDANIAEIISEIMASIKTDDSVDYEVTEIEITNGERVQLKVGETVQLNIDLPDEVLANVKWSISSTNATVSGGTVTALEVGTATVTASYGFISDKIIIEIVADDGTEDITSINITNGDNADMKVGETLKLSCDLPADLAGDVEWSVSNSCASVSEDGTVTALKEGLVLVFARYGKVYDRIMIMISSADSGSSGEDNSGNGGTGGDNGNTGGDNGNTGGDNGNSGDGNGSDSDENRDHIGYQASVSFDPYAGMSEDDFYAGYITAVSYWDAYYRSMHGFMSGELGEQDQKPTISQYQPMINGKYVRNNVGIYGDNGNSYTVVDAYGNPVMTIYRGGGYIMLEEVAAHLFAFGEITANHSTSKKTKPTQSVWGEYLRLNHTQFSGSTTKYPYEPKLPNISGCGGDLTYYELDIGTTGTDCDPSYRAEIYNDGRSITRGAARIVYTVYDKNGDKIVDINEKYLFYTYNHYNDFQEYLNYYGGWGEMFGNITGGGTISSKYDCNPTPYVETIRADISKMVAFVIMPEWYVVFNDKKYA